MLHIIQMICCCIDSTASNYNGIQLQLHQKVVNKITAEWIHMGERPAGWLLNEQLKYSSINSDEDMISRQFLSVISFACK